MAFFAGVSSLMVHAPGESRVWALDPMLPVVLGSLAGLLLVAQLAGEVCTVSSICCSEIHVPWLIPSCLVDSMVVFFSAVVATTCERNGTMFIVPKYVLNHIVMIPSRLSWRPGRACWRGFVAGHVAHARDIVLQRSDGWIH